MTWNISDINLFNMIMHNNFDEMNIKLKYIDNNILFNLCEQLYLNTLPINYAIIHNNLSFLKLLYEKLQSVDIFNKTDIYNVSPVTFSNTL
jgi:hypothetical protein